MRTVPWRAKPLEGCSRESRAFRPDGDRLAVCLKEIHAADELGDEAARRLLVDLRRPADLLDTARVHHGDAIRHDERLALVVRDEHRGDAEPALDRGDLHAHLFAQLEIEVGERLVEQEHRGPDDERARKRDALALPARELERTALGEAAQLD